MTSYVAVEVRREGEESGESVLRRVPVALTSGWGGVFGHPARTARTDLGMRSTIAGMLGRGIRDFGLGPSPVFRRDMTMSDIPDEMAAAPPADRLLDLLMTQRADGSFRMSAAFRELLAEHMDAVEAAIRGSKEAVVVTAVIVRYLELYEASRYHEYRSALKKARKWLRGHKAFDARQILP